MENLSSHNPLREKNYANSGNAFNSNERKNHAEKAAIDMVTNGISAEKTIEYLTNAGFSSTEAKSLVNRIEKKINITHTKRKAKKLVIGSILITLGAIATYYSNQTLSDEYILFGAFVAIIYGVIKLYNGIAPNSYK